MKILNINIQDYLDKVGEWLLSSGLQILLVIIIMLIALRLARIVSKKIFNPFLKRSDDEEFHKRTDTLSAVLRYVFSVAILVTSLLIILGELGIEIGPLLAAAGVVGLAIGFGAQSLVKDLISGFFILMEDQIRVNDVVQIAGKGGLVEKINLRMTVLRDLAGNVHFIPNGQIDVVTNMTKDYSRYVFDIGVAYRENVDEVIEIIKKVDEGLRADPAYANDILEPMEILGLDKFADSAVVIKTRTKTKPIKQWSIAREFNRRLKAEFDRQDIEIPFPHTTLYLGEDKAGQTQPFRVETKTATEQS